MSVPSHEGWRPGIVGRLQRHKIRLADGTALARAFVPLFEVVEVGCAHGPGETMRRVRRRLRLCSPLASARQRFARNRPISLPAMDSTRGVSIVIPVWNQEQLTRACLGAIAAHTPAGRYEVVVVDNASELATSRMLDGVQGLRIVRHRRNLGFVEACNTGAQAARGAYVLFLNNDTKVQPGWLDALCEAMESDPKVGAVGAKLLYPDGRLQEAGSIIWRDGSGWNVGKGRDADAPEYNYVRDVDYCSGACLLVRRDAFDALGGFDRAYAPAYYEDVDLCFRLRERGYRVVYQPEARVVHVEGATAGTDVHAGAKAHQARHQITFRNRHQQALAHQPDPATHDERVARERSRGPRVLVIDHLVPQPDQDAGSGRMVAILRGLADLGCRVTFVPDNLTRVEPYVSMLQQLGIEVLFEPLSISKYLGQHGSTFELAILCRAPVAAKHLPVLRSLPVCPFVVFDTVDLHHVREQRQAAISGDPHDAAKAERTRRLELSVATESDLVWVTSTAEVDVLRSHGAARRVTVVPTIHEVRDDVPGFEARRDVLFVGGFRHTPNEDAVVYFVEAILPLVRRRLPDVRLVVVGSAVPSRVSTLAGPHVEIRGWVPDLAPVLDASRLAVAPLRYGAGVKGKIGQSLASGLPVVTTPVGAEGMGLQHGVHVLVGDSAEAFADHVVAAYTDAALWTRLATQGRNHARATMTPVVVREALADLLTWARPAARDGASLGRSDQPRFKTD